jgi:hypothetical protein
LLCICTTLLKVGQIVYAHRNQFVKILYLFVYINSPLNWKPSTMLNHRVKLQYLWMQDYLMIFSATWLIGLQTSIHKFSSLHNEEFQAHPLKCYTSEHSDGKSQCVISYGTRLRKFASRSYIYITWSLLVTLKST